MKIRLLLNLAIAIVLIFLTGEYDGQRADIVETLEKQSYDWRIQRNAKIERKNNDIVIVDIDDDSLREFGAWPWSRDHFADLVDRLFKQYKVRAAAFTLPFPEPDNVALRLLQDMEKRLAEGVSGAFFGIGRLQKLHNEFDYDTRFADALHNQSVVLGYIFGEAGRTAAALPPPITFAANDGELPMGALSILSDSWHKMRSFSGNLPLFLRSTGNSGGHVNLFLDNDGIVRRLPFYFKHAGDYYMSLPIALLRQTRDIPHSTPIALKYETPAGGVGDLEKRRFIIGRYEAPFNPDGSGYLNFLGKGGRSVDFHATPGAVFRYLSFSEVVHGQAPENVLHNKIVLIGSSAGVAGGLHATPVNPEMPAVELIATQLANIMQGDTIYRESNTLLYETLILVFSCLLLSLLFVYLGPILSVFLLAAVFAGHIMFVLHQWEANHQVWAMIPLLLVTSGLYICNAISGFIFEWYTSRRLQSTFSQYLPPEVAKKVGASNDKINLEGEMRELTVLFSDVRNFTSISEAMSPRELTLLMNRMLTGLTEAIHRHGGTVDKYIGDAVMAFWNAPLEDARHAPKAVLAAFDMQAAIQKLSQEFVANGFQEIQLGVGICTGDANVGNMGSSLRMTYTAIGDTVNLSSRTEGMTKQYGTPILVTESTYAQCNKSEITFRAADVVRVKGRVQPVTLYEPIGATELIPPERLALLKEFESIRASYTAGEFTTALDKVRAYLKKAPDDELAAVYQARLEQLLQNPPQQWDGITSYDYK